MKDIKRKIRKQKRKVDKEKRLANLGGDRTLIGRMRRIKSFGKK